jgi:hypothetical protein
VHIQHPKTIEQETAEKAGGELEETGEQTVYFAKCNG